MLFLRITARAEKKISELRESFFTQRAAPIQVVAPALIAVSKQAFILSGAAGEPS